MSKSLGVFRSNASNPKVWVLIGVTVAGIVVLAETRRRRRLKSNRADFGAFVERFEILPFPQPPPPAAKQSLFNLSFAIKDIFEVKDHVTSFGSPAWKRSHENAEKMAVVVTALLKNGATCIGKTVMDELGFGITGESKHYGTPINPKAPSCIPGGSSSGSAVAVAAQLVDFALGTDTVGCIRIPAAFTGILGYRPSHGAVSTVGVLPVAQSLDTVGWFARDPSILHQVGCTILQLNVVEPRRTKCLLFADDLFQFYKVPQHKTFSVITKVIEKLSGYEHPKHINLSEHIAKNVSSLKGFHENSTKVQNGTSALKALSSVMISLQRYEFKSNHEEWVKSASPNLASEVAKNIHLAINSTYDNVKMLYKVRTELRATLQALLKDNKILVIPTVADPPSQLNSKNAYYTECNERALMLSSIASISGCCQVAIPLGEHDNFPISVSFIAYHGGDKFLLDTLLDMYSSLQEQASIASNSALLPDTNGDIDTSEILKEKGNAAFRQKLWNKAVNYYTEAIKLNNMNTVYYCNRAAAYLELGWSDILFNFFLILHVKFLHITSPICFNFCSFQQAEEDCMKAISLDKKNVKAYLRRGTARESLLHYKDAAHDFSFALVLEPQNKVASQAVERLKKLMS
ncbi:hypothetical protein K2173_022228 [Erythroxylum novogranatense]|uniref:Amidase domain-containing protein n=1 Tax=Erythroxylum novogranatense TaxID=1862640 RepID=A0AAV8SUA4_9ROSI|nr:hypothetical protein K2173_022228 [Erythroxylum novogranatense]